MVQERLTLLESLRGISQDEMVIWKVEKKRQTLPLVANRNHPQIVMDAVSHSTEEGPVSSRETCWLE